MTRWINVGRGAPSPFFVVFPSLLLFRSLLPSSRTSSSATKAKPTKTKAIRKPSSAIAVTARHHDHTSPENGGNLSRTSTFEVRIGLRLLDPGFPSASFAGHRGSLGFEARKCFSSSFTTTAIAFFSVTPYDILFNFNLGAEW